MQSELYLPGSILIVMLGLLFARSFSGEVFERAVAASGVPTPTRYLVRRRPFFYGKIIYVCFCLGVYIFLLVFYQEIPALVELLPGAAKAQFAEYVAVIEDSSHPSLLVTTVALTTAFLQAVRNDFPGNVMYLFRSIVYSSISVTFAYDRIRERILNGLHVPAHDRQVLASDPALGIVLVHFNLPATDIRRQWAELAYMRRWVESTRALGPGHAIFTEASFDLSRSSNRFVALRELIRGYKIAPSDPDRQAAMAEILEELRHIYARYMSCLLLTLAGSRQSLHDLCRDAGIDPGPMAAENPIGYSAIYVITLAGAVVVGPYLFAAGYDLVTGTGADAAFLQQNMDFVHRWLIKGLAVYFSPIFVVLVIRYIAWRVSPVRSYASLVTYAWISICVFATSVLGGVLTSILSHIGPVDTEDVERFLWVSAPWSVGPALTCLYINYYLDRQADPAKENIVQTPATFLIRLFSVLRFTAAIVVFSLLVVAQQHYAGNGWTEQKTRVVVLGTVALITMSLCMVAQFGLRKRHPRVIVGQDVGNTIAAAQM
jgi:hypothetical protein